MQYKKEFELVVEAMKNLDTKVEMGVFLNGLKNGIQAKLKVSQFKTLAALMDKDLELEERNLA